MPRICCLGLVLLPCSCTERLSETVLLNHLHGHLPDKTLHVPLSCCSTGHLLRSGKYEGLPGVTVLPCCKTLAVRALGPTSSATAAGTAAPMHIPKWEIDGEAQGQCGQVTIEMLPGALQLCI